MSMAAIYRDHFLRRGFATWENNFFSPGSYLAFYTGRLKRYREITYGEGVNLKWTNECVLTFA
jgi:hypothetical protein